MNERRPPSPDPSGYSGPWSDLPPSASPKQREPWIRLRRSKGGREPWIRNWRGVAIVVFLLFVAPPLAGWLSRLIMGMAQGG